MSERIRKFIISSFWAKWRSDNANHTIDRISELDDSEYFDPERYFPLYHLELAASLFSKGGEFDYASIFHSSSALALGLLIKLSTNLTDEEKRKIKRLGFKTLIEKCRDKGLLDKEHYGLAEDIRNIRNCYVHFENMMAYFNQLQRYLKDREGILRTYRTEEERRIVKMILNSQSADTISVPDITWCADTSTVSFLETRHARFGRGLVKILAEIFKKDLEVKKVKRAYQRFEGLFQTAADASYCLNNTAKVLTHIGILPAEKG
jgi:hypothetical protein